MPYHLAESENKKGWFVEDDQGKKHSKKPLPKNRAIRQMRVLWAAEKKEASPNKTVDGELRSAGEFLVVEDESKPSTWHLPVKRGGKPDRRLMGAAWAALHEGYRGNTYKGPQKQIAIKKLERLYEANKWPVPNSASKDFSSGMGIAVFKDHSGQYRWVTKSSNPYRDRDREIVSFKALNEDVSRMDASGDYGPLRWWHVPNIDIGICDFNMMHGKILIESGTFINENVALAVKKEADNLEVSIAFLHPLDEPDRNGIYHTIRRYERSLVPKGMVSNLFTGLTVHKE